MTYIKAKMTPNNFDVKLISHTESLITDNNGKKLSPEDFIVYCARISNPSNQMNLDTSHKLIKYLIEHKHWSPFEMVTVAFSIVTSRGIAQQILRHRSFSFQEFSQRYAVANEQVVYPARRQDLKNRQNSIDNINEDDQEWFKLAQDKVWKTANHFYKEALDKGIAKECARFVLPLNTQTNMIMSGTVRSWIHYLQTRLDPATQLEHREIAQAIFDQFQSQFPNVCKYIFDDLERHKVKPSPLSVEEKKEVITD